jgi:hypothetical protein
MKTRHMQHPLLRATFVVALAILWVGTPIEAKKDDDQDMSVRIPDAGDEIFRVPHTDAEIGIDGVIDEKAWDNALKLDLSYEVSPADNKLTEIKTEALLTYNKTHFFAAFRASDPNPDLIRARFSDRDSAFQDDFVGIVIDTFNDERRAFEFFVNAMGVQMDLIQDDVNGNEDSSWDAIWDAAGRLTEYGYEVELAIPYTSLRFQKEDGDQVWGLDLLRIYPRDQRFLLSNNRRDKDVSCYLCQVGKIVGFDGATPGKNIEITPTFTSGRTDSKNFVNSPNGNFSRPDGNFEQGEANYDPGLTAKWGITPNMTLSGTINPDFSQVEADAAQLSVNNQFALFFREKRPFFLEGADFFDTPLRAVHTRSVNDPKWGGKLTGKTGKNALGAFVAQDELPSIILPGSQGSSILPNLNQDLTTGVFRYRRDVGKNSAVGALLTTREGGSGFDYHNRVFGVDAVLRPAESDTIRLQALGSQTQYTESIASDFGQPEGQFADGSYFVNYSHNEKYWNMWARYQDLGNNFRSDLGFIPRVGIRQPIIGAQRKFWGEDGDWWSRGGVGGDWDQTVDHEGNLLEREYEMTGWIKGPMQLDIWGGIGHRQFGFRDEMFRQDFVSSWIEFRPIGDFWIGVSSGYSKRVDFAYEDPHDPGASRQGDEFRIEPSIRYDLGKRIRLNLSHQLTWLDVDKGQAFKANQTELNVAYQMTLRSFFRAILQYVDVDRDLSTYPTCNTKNFAGSCGFNPETRTLFSQLLFSYKINPQTALFLGYTDNQLAQVFDDQAQFQDHSLTRTDRSIFFKVGYAFVD